MRPGFFARAAARATLRVRSSNCVQVVTFWTVERVGAYVMIPDYLCTAPPFKFNLAQPR